LIEPFECTLLGPLVETVERFAIAPESVIVVVPLQSPVEFPDELFSLEVAIFPDPFLDSLKGGNNVAKPFHVPSTSLRSRPCSNLWAA
jgi:hypothetical protein